MIKLKRSTRKKISWLKKSVFCVSALAGAFVSTSAFFAFHPNPVYWILPFIESFCGQVEGFATVYRGCTAIVSYAVLISLIIGALLIYYRIKQKKHFVVGLSFYISGWVTGFVIMSLVWTYLFSLL
ncbi:MAG: hypothetical protein ACMXYA_00855 [Candidatus Woesearchaeota archaeon]